MGLGNVLDCNPEVMDLIACELESGLHHVDQCLGSASI